MTVNINKNALQLDVYRPPVDNILAKRVRDLISSLPRQSPLPNKAELPVNRQTPVKTFPSAYFVGRSVMSK